MVKYCFDQGLILLACGAYGNVIRLLMPLVIDDAQFDRGMEIVHDGLAYVQNSGSSR